jgi:hypothetical protein
MYVLLLSFNTEKVGGERFIELHLFFQTSEGIMLEEVEFRSCRTIGRKLEEEFEWDWLLGTKKDTRWWVWGFWYILSVTIVLDTINTVLCNSPEAYIRILIIRISIHVIAY